MTICRPKRITKLKFQGVRIAWNFDEDHIQDAFEKFWVPLRTSEGRSWYRKNSCQSPQPIRSKGVSIPVR
jgi:hypothetical protein